MICGIDEAGRGPLAGPVCAAAVVLPEIFPRDTLDDSKRLGKRRREEAAAMIYAKASAWGIGWATHSEIDKVNILEASLLAMMRAFHAMMEEADEAFLREMLKAPRFEVIVDGNRKPSIPCPKRDAFSYDGDFSCRTLVKADAQVPEVMAASILAKTTRDALMCDFALMYPSYGYEKHKGYPTKEHIRILKMVGPSPIQRLTFSYGEKGKQKGPARARKHGCTSDSTR
ncbi:MAG: ribonuclease HII [Spirochaetaceae bacterium]|jgi:ribonuclease HII|nr:ribonuclease HII [Spirochaetaceae bacterium]